MDTLTAGAYDLFHIRSLEDYRSIMSCVTHFNNVDVVNLLDIHLRYVHTLQGAQILTDSACLALKADLDHFH